MHCTTRIKPKALCIGDTIGIVAPAGCGDPELAAAGVSALEAYGFKVRQGLTVGQKLGYLAGPDAERAAEVNAMFASPEIDGIICLRGGYGSMRLLDRLDYDIIRQHPKVFVGYSDITAMHLSIGQKTGLVTFHGPMVASDLGKGISPHTWDYLFRAVSKPEPLGLVANPPGVVPPVFIAPGAARGPLTGGNLSLVTATLGTPYEIDARGKILCLEEVGEEPYRIDRMLTQLLLAGKLRDAAGIVFDVCAACEAEDDSPGFTLAEVLQDRLGSLRKPVLCNLYFGHAAEKATLPLGIEAVLDSRAGNLAVTEAAVMNA